MANRKTRPILANLLTVCALGVTGCKALTLAYGEPTSPEVVFSTGSIDLPPGARADLDNGTLGPTGADLWYRDVGPSSRGLEPINGAAMALGDGTNRGLAGCIHETFSSAILQVTELSVGTHICVRTGDGRISQFRVDAYPGCAAPCRIDPYFTTTMKIDYTTWAN